MVLNVSVHHPTSWPWTAWPTGGGTGGRLLFLPNGFPTEEMNVPGGQALAVRRAMEVSAGNPALRQINQTDVLCLLLYEDNLIHPIPRGMARRVDYEETLALIRELGSTVGGIMVGNQLGTEISYRHMHGTWRGDAVANCTAIAEFVREVGHTLRDAGAKPVFGVMNWDIIQDAYKGDQRILAALNEVEATNYIACGYAMVPGAYIKPGLDEFGDHLRWQSELTGGGWSLPYIGEDFNVLGHYLHAGRFWSGLCGLTGIRSGNLQVLSDYGFKGFATKIQPSEQIELIEMLGPNWWV